MRRFYPETFFIALAVILLEVSYTRVFSYKLVYYFTYLIIGISLLGLGAGGVFVAVFERLRKTATERVLLVSCVVAAVAVIASYLLVALVPLHLFRMMMSLAHGMVAGPLWTLAKLSLVLFVLFIPTNSWTMCTTLICRPSPKIRSSTTNSINCRAERWCSPTARESMRKTCCNICRSRTTSTRSLTLPRRTTSPNLMHTRLTGSWTTQKSSPRNLRCSMICIATLHPPRISA